MGRDHSADGLGYGPVYFISRYSMSTAYLATAHFKDQDALSARIIQARFTGHFRFACQVPKRPNHTHQILTADTDSDPSTDRVPGLPGVYERPDHLGRRKQQP